MTTLAQVNEDFDRLPQFQIVASVSGVWHYHLAKLGNSPARSLCGDRTMATSAPLSSWGHKPAHYRSSYCQECARAAGLPEQSK